MHARRAARIVDLVTAVVCAVVASACADDSSGKPSAIPWTLEALPALPEVTVLDAKRAALGRLLFYDPVLSLDAETACATCHSELWGMSDGLPLSIGVGGGTLTGPGRRGTPAGNRNAQTLWNVAYRSELFWDGRASSLEAQALIPLQTAAELGRAPADVAVALRAIGDYVAMFADAFPGDPDPITESTLAFALAAFQRTLLSSHTPYDAYVAGDQGALSERAVLGMQLFAELSCNGCHTPPLFESTRYAARNVADVRIDPGRFAITAQAIDSGAFRVPTLRNAIDTGPYFHDGSISTLREAVLHELSVEHTVGARTLDDQEIDALVEFLEEGLLDVSANPDRPDVVPSGLPVPRDGFRIPR